MLHTFADDVDTMVHNQPMVLPEQAQEMREDTPWPLPPVPEPRLQTIEPHPRPCTPETRLLSWLEY